MRVILAVTAFVCAVAFASAAAPVFYTDRVTNTIRETATGRSTLMHGVNVVVKVDPYIPYPDGFTGNSFSPTDAAVLKSLGFNVIRLGVMWSGVEPVRDQYNATYLAVARQVVDTAGAAGIYTLVEFHQDLLAARYCADGVPLWALDPAVSANFPAPLEAPYPVDNSTGTPDWQYCGKLGWFEYYFSEAVTNEFGRLYDVNSTFHEEFAQYWEQVTNTFADSDWVVGYEIINEPFAGNIYAEPKLILPSVADLLMLQPFYDSIARRIRAIDSRHLIFFEPVTWDDFGVGFTDVPGGREAYGNASVLSYHYYAPPQLGSPAQNMAVRRKDIAKLQTAGFLTEFWVEDQGPNSYAPMQQTVDAADEYGQSWIGWCYKAYQTAEDFGSSVFFLNGTINPTIVGIISRTYAQVTAGVVHRGVFNATTRVYSLEFETASWVSSPVTSIYLNEEMSYPNGFDVAITPATAATWAYVDTNRVEVMNAADVSAGTTITVTITPQ